ncbi:MAG TPA: NAD-dependent epimerase/dehydratase family protein [Thermoanaerobaculia bacterium]|nr:NAD-dependent epimerase/dehydratase family protein [Thermoanaerobaculia bacterium]
MNPIVGVVRASGAPEGGGAPEARATRPVVITGASGFLGRHLLAHYLGRGRDVIALTRDRRRLDDLSHAHLRVQEVDYGGAIDLPPSSTIIYCASMRNAPKPSPHSFTRANVTEPLNVATRGRAQRFIHLGTALVLGSSITPLDDSAPLAPSNDPYIRSKHDAITALETSGVPLITILPSIIYGPDSPRSPNRITSHMRRLLSKKLRFGVQTPPRNLVFVNDVVRAIVQAEEHGVLGAHYLVAGDNVTMAAFEDEVFAAAGKRPTPRIRVPKSFVTASGQLIDRVLGYDASSGWTARARTLLAPWCFRMVRARNELAVEPTPLAAGVQRTLAAL